MEVPVRPATPAPEVRVAAQEPATDKPVVRLRNVFRRYGYHWALRDVSLEVPRGAVVAVVGPNGSGKTTLLKVIATLLRPHRGSVELFGQDVAKRPEEVRRQVGLLSHHTYVYEELTARENLEFAAAMYGLGGAEVAARVDAALRSVGLAAAADRRVRTFSSGMRKRLALARATIHAPALVLLDEPYGALDADGRAWVDERVASFGTQGATAIVATHHVHRVLGLCREVVWLRAGRVAYRGEPEGLPREARRAGVAGEA